MTTPLDKVPQLNPYQVVLRRLGYSTLEDLLGASQVARPELEAFLQTPLQPLLSPLAGMASKLTAQEQKTFEEYPYCLGVSLALIPRLSMAPAVPLGPSTSPAAGFLARGPVAPPPALPAGVNWVPDMPPIRDQQHRGTCVAFGSLAAYEHFLKIQGNESDLAEQFLYWNCKANDGHSDEEGTWVGVAYPLLQRDGCCLESKWPYNPNPIPNNEGQGPPPAGAQLQALTYRLHSYHQLAPTSVQDIKTTLANRRCVTFSIPVFNSWYRNSWVAKTGDIVMPVPGEIPVGGHAMCLVGYQDLPSNPEIEGGRFILRNSWGQSWGFSSPYGAGYGTIPYGYISRFCQEAYCIA